VRSRNRALSESVAPVGLGQVCLGAHDRVPFVVGAVASLRPLAAVGTERASAEVDDTEDGVGDPSSQGAAVLRARDRGARRVDDPGLRHLDAGPAQVGDAPLVAGVEHRNPFHGRIERRRLAQLEIVASTAQVQEFDAARQHRTERSCPTKHHVCIATAGTVQHFAVCSGSDGQEIVVSVAVDVGHDNRGAQAVTRHAIARVPLTAVRPSNFELRRVDQQIDDARRERAPEDVGLAAISVPSGRSVASSTRRLPFLRMAIPD